MIAPWPHLVLALASCWRPSLSPTVTIHCASGAPESAASTTWPWRSLLLSLASALRVAIRLAFPLPFQAGPPPVEPCAAADTKSAANEGR